MRPRDAGQDGFDLAGPSRHDPGGRACVRWSPLSVVSAEFGGPQDCYRYALREVWVATLPRVLWLMMNPSTADTRFADPTLARCSAFTRRWRGELGGPFGGMLVGNVFGYRATDQTALGARADPVGPGNLDALRRMAAESSLIVAAFGCPHVPSLRAHGPRTLAVLVKELPWLPVVGLGRNADGSPKHPLYVRGDTVPARYDNDP